MEKHWFPELRHALDSSALLQMDFSLRDFLFRGILLKAALEERQGLVDHISHTLSDRDAGIACTMALEQKIVVSDDVVG